MRTNNTILDIVAILLFAGAAMAWQHSQNGIQKYRWVVLKKPIHLEDGFIISHPFTVDVGAKYWVEVRCCKTIPFELLDETLCRKLVAEFNISSGTNSIASGDSVNDFGAGYSDEFIDRYIGSFDAVPGVPYTLEFRIKASLPKLDSTRPLVRISIDSLVFKDAFVTAALSAYFSYGLALAGVMCLAMVVWSFVRRQNDRIRNV
jgi:hypothetical protein